MEKQFKEAITNCIGDLHYITNKLDELENLSEQQEEIIEDLITENLIDEYEDRIK